MENLALPLVSGETAAATAKTTISLPIFSIRERKENENEKKKKHLQFSLKNTLKMNAHPPLIKKRGN